MIEHWQWIALAALSVFAVAQQFRVIEIGRAAKRREELFQIVTENAADMIALVDVKGKRLYNSPAYKRILGYSPSELSETSAFDQIHPDDRFNVLEAAREARDSGTGKTLEYRIKHKNGTWRVLESVAGTIRDKNGNVEKLVIVNRDVTERKRAEERAEHNAFHDGPTGLPNRQLFLNRLHHAFERFKRDLTQPYALILVDLDGFKTFNQSMGPSAADEVIIEIGSRVENCLRDQDTVARSQVRVSSESALLSRLAGDEFAVLLEGVGDPSDAMRATRRIMTAVAAPLEIEGRELRITASVGIALSAASHYQADDLLQEADIAMRRAKALGGSRCEVFDEAMHTRAINRLQLEAELRDGLRENEFRVFYQPIVELATRRIAGFEALLRWQHPREGLISPAKFLDAAEDTGLLVSAGQVVILEACRRLKDWKAAMPDLRRFHIGVNISSRQLADPNFISDLEAILRDTGADPANLRVELTEAVAREDEKLTRDVLSQLGHLKVKVILDDFGAGDSSVNSLRKLPVHALKIDRSLVNGILADRGVYDTVDLMIVLAHKMKLVAIAEGIETLKHWEAVRDLGCDLGQGYFFAPPLSVEAADALLLEQGSNQKANAASIP